MHRLFLGIEVDEATRASCAAVAARLERAGVRAKFVVQENYHLTLFFFGNVAPERIAGIEGAMRGAASRHAPFTIALDRIGAFPHERNPRIIFLGSRGADPAYRALARDISEQSEGLGFTNENDAVPHVTLARVPDHARTALPAIDVTPISIAVDAATLFESIPHEGRTRYESRSAFELAKES